MCTIIWAERLVKNVRAASLWIINRLQILLLRGRFSTLTVVCPVNAKNYEKLKVKISKIWFIGYQIKDIRQI